MPHSFHRYEKYLFFILILIHLIPVCSTHFFITLDGPAHLYNSNLINWMLYEPDGLAGTYFYFNPLPPPNISGHVLLCVFNFFLPSYLAEKCLLIIYITALPLTFRLLIARLGSTAFSYFIFPFIYSDFLYEGFFNFCLSIPLFFLLLAYFIKHREIQDWTEVITLFFLMGLLYFSHFLVFLLGFSCVGLLIIWNAGLKWRKIKSTKSKESVLKFLFKQLALLLFLSIPGIILALGFLRTNWDQGETAALQKSEIWRQFCLFKPVFTLSYTSLLFWMFIALLGTAFFNKWKNGKQQPTFSAMDVWLFFCLLLLVLVFILPNEWVSGGFISTRLMLFIYLIAFLWLSAQTISKYLVYAAIVLSTGVSLIILRYYRMEMKKNDKIASACFEAASCMEENSVVLPLNYADKLVLNNVLTYIGSEKKIVVWDNYEALTTHFPLQWKENYLPNEAHGNYLNSNRPWVNIQLMEKDMGMRMDYVVRVCYNKGMEDPSTLYMNKKLAEGYVLIKRNEWVEVYKAKPMACAMSLSRSPATASERMGDIINANPTPLSTKGK